MTTVADATSSTLWLAFVLLLIGCTLWLVTHAIRSYLRRFD